jgi:hypothetical protein
MEDYSKYPSRFEINHLSWTKWWSQWTQKNFADRLGLSEMISELRGKQFSAVARHPRQLPLWALSQGRSLTIELSLPIVHGWCQNHVRWSIHDYAHDFPQQSSLWLSAWNVTSLSDVHFWKSEETMTSMTIQTPILIDSRSDLFLHFLWVAWSMLRHFDTVLIFTLLLCFKSSLKA